MSRWEEYMFNDRIYEILKGVKYKDEKHHFGRPFISAYQLAIEFALKYPEDFKKISLKIGGKGIEEENSLAQYMAGELSRRIKSGELVDIEGSFFSNLDLKDIILEFNNEEIKSSLTKTQYHTCPKTV